MAFTWPAHSQWPGPSLLGSEPRLSIWRVTTFIVCYMKCQWHDLPGVSWECHVVQSEQVHGGAPSVHRPGHGGRLKNGLNLRLGVYVSHYIFILMTKAKRRVLLEVNKYIIIYSNEFSNIACGKQTIFIMVAIVTLLLNTHIVPVLHIYVIFSEPMLLELLFTRVINSWFLLLGMTPERKESSRKTAGQWHHNLH